MKKIPFLLLYAFVPVFSLAQLTTVYDSRSIISTGTPSFSRIPEITTYPGSGSSTAILPFNVISPLSPTANYTGPVFYGGYKTTVTDAGVGYSLLPSVASVYTPFSGTISYKYFGSFGTLSMPDPLTSLSSTFVVAFKVVPGAYETASSAGFSFNGSTRMLAHSQEGWFVSATPSEENLQFGQWAAFNTDSFTSGPPSSVSLGAIDYVGVVYEGNYSGTRSGSLALSLDLRLLTLSGPRTPVPSAVPEPSTSGMMFVGVVLVIAAFRSAQRNRTAWRFFISGKSPE